MSRHAPAKPPHRHGLPLILLGATLWATLPVFSRIAYASGSDGVTAAAMRAYLAAAIFLVWLLQKGTFKRLKLKDISFYLVYGLTGIGGTFLFYMLAIERISTAMAAILLYTGPAFVILISRLMYRETITTPKLLALISTFSGLTLVVRIYDPAALKTSWTGILIGLASGLCYSMTTVLGRIAKTKHSGPENAGLMIVFGSAVFLFIKPPWKLPAPTPTLWLAYLGLAVLGSVLAYAFYLQGLERGIDGGTASLAATIEPVLATVFTVMVFGDRLEPLQILGMIIVLGGIAIPLLPQPRPALSREKPGEN